jgi:hypothetical protein
MTAEKTLWGEGKGNCLMKRELNVLYLNLSVHNRTQAGFFVADIFPRDLRRLHMKSNHEETKNTEENAKEG